MSKFNDDLRTLILATAECLPYVVTPDMPKQDASGKDATIAGILNQPAGERLVQRQFTAISLMAELGAITGATILEKLEAASASNPVLKWAMLAARTPPGIDFGHIETQKMVDMCVTADVITSEEGIKMKSLGKTSSSLALAAFGKAVTGAEVSNALRGGGN